MTTNKILSDPTSYIWSQTDDQVSVTFLVPKTARSRDIVIELHTDELHAGLRGIEPIIKGKLYAQIRSSDSVWQMEPGLESSLVDSNTAARFQLLTLHLEKLVRGAEWPVVITETTEGDAQVDIASQFYLGKMYESADPVKAFKYYLSAARNGHIASQLKLAAMYEIGKEKSSLVPVERSAEKAFYWHLEAAKCGDAEACYIVGTSYSNGHGVKKSYPDAIKYFKIAMDLAQPSLEEAAPDSRSSQVRGSYAFFVNSAFRTGLMYLEGGHGIVAEPSLALEFWKQSANSGHAQSMYNTGILYLNGVGTAKNLDKAAKYIQNAIELDPKLKMPEALVNHKKLSEVDVQEGRRKTPQRAQTTPRSRKYSAPSPSREEPLSEPENGASQAELSEEVPQPAKTSRKIKKRKSRKSSSKPQPADDGIAWLLLGTLTALTVGLVVFSAVRRPATQHLHTVPRSVSRSVAGVQVI
ncbi:HCP-like protein [Basidiobolus meristosporus CBS 931.73]|uniref:HCP-like protein n=1 Tax=Basidiobolus meristosporus CBS 931.73 TaxID=1314790 RepID=A0A1Y1YIX3_9FUNG|nr:HCP-like protein [Basidiobolus meristosporus CBS 931.73]|eukprot:ORX97932.1 HCP-like protein [Basidiobolus meristosporus CBS 931.73]